MATCMKRREGKKSKAADDKRKAFTDEQDDIKKKRAGMEADICAIEKSVDENRCMRKQKPQAN